MVVVEVVVRVWGRLGVMVVVAGVNDRGRVVFGGIGEEGGGGVGVGPGGRREGGEGGHRRRRIWVVGFLRILIGTFR